MAAPSTTLAPRSSTRPERPRLYKVILLNDDYTPREFVVSSAQGGLPDGTGTKRSPSC